MVEAFYFIVSNSIIQIKIKTLKLKLIIMKKISHLLILGITIGTFSFFGCKKKDDPTPDPIPDAPVVTSTMTSSNEGNSGAALASMSVTTSTGFAKLRLDVTSVDDIDRIYVMKSEDNGSLSPLVINTIVASSGTFTGGSNDYSLTIPSNTKTFVIDIPVSVRTSSSAVTDVYYVWITNGTGAFTKPTKNLKLGSAVITLNYTSSTSKAYSSGAVQLGDQYATPGSLLVTAGQIAALNTADYVDAPSSSDIAMGDLDAGATTRTSGGGTGNLYLFSPSLRSSLGYAGCASCGIGGIPLAEPIGNVTYIAVYSGSASFESATGSDLEGLSVGSNQKVAVTANGVYMFETARGKKGLLKVTSTTDGSAGNGTANVSVKVLN